MDPPRDPLAQKVEEACLEWQGSRNKQGYGRIGWKNPELEGSDWRVWWTHRLAWIVQEDDGVGIPRGYVIDHLCRNPACCNPKHLEPVTGAENRRRGLIGRGSRNRNAKLSEESVSQARKDWLAGTSYRELADRSGVHVETIKAAVRGDSWKHVEPRMTKAKRRKRQARLGMGYRMAPNTQEELVKAIRALVDGTGSDRQVDIARRFGVSEARVSQIKRRLMERS